MSSRAIGAWERMGSSRWHGAASSALVSRSRAMPAGGRPSSPGGGAKPSPRLFSLTDVRCRALVGARCRCEHRRSLVNAPSGLSASGAAAFSTATRLGGSVRRLFGPSGKRGENRGNSWGFGLETRRVQDAHGPLPWLPPQNQTSAGSLPAIAQSKNFPYFNDLRVLSPLSTALISYYNSLLTAPLSIDPPDPRVAQSFVPARVSRRSNPRAVFESSRRPFLIQKRALHGLHY